MLDTIKVESPPLTEAQAAIVRGLLKRRICIDTPTGTIEWDFNGGELDGSYDHRMKIDLKCERWIAVDRGYVVNLAAAGAAPGPARLDLDYVSKPMPKKVECAPYLVVEGSIHKALLGHNVEGGPLELLPSVRWLVDQLRGRFGLDLPDADGWIVRRVDWAEVFDLGTFEAAQEYFSWFKNVRYPRRTVSLFGDHGVAVPGKVTSTKGYHKGPELQQHDKPRLKRAMGAQAYMELQQRANMLVRFEVGIPARTLDNEYPTGPTAAAISMAFLRELYSADMGRLLREGESAMETVRTAVAVKRRLFDQYSPSQARALYGTWLELSAMGEKSARESLRSRKTQKNPRGGLTTFYDHRKKLEAAGCSWLGGNVKLDERVSLVPAGFAPLLHDPRRLTAEAPEVVDQLAPYRRSA